MIYPEKVPYLTLFSQKIMLSPGIPLGYGNMIYLFSKSIDDSINMINKRDTLYHTNNYRYYFYTMKYSGKIRSKSFKINDRQIRDKIYEKIIKNTDLTPMKYTELKQSGGRNCFFELSRYLEIFQRLSKNIPPLAKAKMFWDYLSGVLNDSMSESYPNRIILIDCEQYSSSFSGQLKDKLDSPLFLIYYTLLKNPSLLKNIDIDMFIYYKNKCIKINPGKLVSGKMDGDEEKLSSSELSSKIKTGTSRYKQLLMRLMTHEANEILASTDSSRISKEEEIEAAISKKIDEYHFIGDAESDEITDFNDINTPNEIRDEIENIARDAISDEEDFDSDDREKDLEAKIDEAISEDDDLKIKIDSEIIPVITPKSKANTARDAKIREQQANIKVGSSTIAELQDRAKNHIPISKIDVASSISTTNKNMQTVTFANFDKDYNEKLFPSDMVNVFTSLNNKSIPMTIIKYNVTDTSDELNYKDTYTVVLEDAYRQRHTITVDIPKFIDGRYMWIGGSKKIILCQNFLLPVVKCGPNKVQIVTNTNKMFIERVGSNSISSIERINKLIASSEEAAKYFTAGYSEKLNENYITTVEYDEFSKKFIKFHCGSTKIFFSQKDAEEQAESHGVVVGENDIFIGFKGSKPIFIDQNTQKTENGEMIIDIIAESFPENVLKEFEKIKPPKRLMYSNATTMEQPIALCMLLGLWKGLSYLMTSMKLKYRLEDNKKRVAVSSNEGMIKFKDCTLIYEDDVASSLIMNGFRKTNTEDWNIADFDTKEPYIPYLVKVYGRINVVNALMTNYEWNIDPITEEILKDMHLPTEMVELSVYANSLLADSQYTPDYNQRLCRIRTNEIIPAILYDALAKQYVIYKNSNGKKKFTIPRNIVIKNLLSLKTVEDNSTLNPVLELERKHVTMYKGWRGINNEEAYTIDKRVYDNSMVGIIGTTSSPDGAVGVQKTLTMEPKINSLRGFTEITENVNELKDVNLSSPGEMLTPLSVTQDDPTRVGHMIKQAKHMLPVKHSSPVLISNGAEEIARFNLSSAFVINAKDDGKVVDYDETLGLIVCEYKDGTYQAINLNPTIEKNGGGGFFLSNRLITNLKLGDKFKKNDMLAWHKDFFHSDMYSGNRMNNGTLAKVALMSTYNTYNDSTVITENLSEELASEMVFQKQIVIGKNANLDFLIEEGAAVNVGDTLAQFDTSFEDNELNELLNALSSDLKEGVLEGSRNDIRSKYAGVIEAIKIYSTVELSDLSPSLQRAVKKYYKKVSDTKKFLGRYDSSSPVLRCGVLLDEADHKVEPNRFGVIKGQNVEDAVLIEIYIKHEEYLEPGSKCTYFTGLKTTVNEVIPKGLEPWSEFRPDEIVGSIVAPNSVLKRMVPSVMITSLGNKCLVELKRSLKEIFDKNKSSVDELKKKMTSLIYRFFTAMDKSGTNTEKYKKKFDPMNPTVFKKWFEGFFKDQDAYLILDIVEYKRPLTITDIEKAAKVLNIPLYEYVYFPHLTQDKSNAIRSREKIAVGYLHIKRPQQTIAKKNGLSTSMDVRSSLTNQVTGVDKNGRESDLENIMLTSLGMENTLKELNGPRSDDSVMKSEMLSSIATQGFARYSDLTNDISNKTTLNTVDTFFIGMGLKTDLVTKGLMTKSTLKKDM